MNIADHCFYTICRVFQYCSKLPGNKVDFATVKIGQARAHGNRLNVKTMLVLLPR